MERHQNCKIRIIPPESNCKFSPTFDEGEESYNTVKFSSAGYLRTLWEEYTLGKAEFIAQINRELDCIDGVSISTQLAESELLYRQTLASLITNMHLTQQEWQVVQQKLKKLRKGKARLSRCFRAIYGKPAWQRVLEIIGVAKFHKEPSIAAWQTLRWCTENANRFQDDFERTLENLLQKRLERIVVSADKANFTLSTAAEKRESKQTQTNILVKIDAFAQTDNETTVENLGHIFDSEETFAHFTEVKGYALIIVNHRFEDSVNFPTLPGRTCDAARLLILLPSLGFHVLLLVNRTAKQMRHDLRRFAKKDHKSSAIVCVLSHGGRSGVFGVDGKVVSAEKLAKEIDNVRCQQLLFKPKLLLVDACRGNRDDGTIAPIKRCNAAIAGDADTIMENVPELADMLIWHSTSNGFTTIVDASGSPFITSLYEVISKNVHKEDVHKLATDTNRQLRANDDAQCPEFKSTLSKQWFIFPGITEEVPNGARIVCETLNSSSDSVKSRLFHMFRCIACSYLASGESLHVSPTDIQVYLRLAARLVSLELDDGVENSDSDTDDSL